MRSNSGKTGACGAMNSRPAGIRPREAGTALVNRRGNRITLTPACRILLEHTERILVELRAAEATLSRDDQAVSGLLRVGVPFREGPQIMSHALMEVRRQFPKLEIRLIAATDETSADALLRDQLDMAIVSRFGAPQPRPRSGLREWDLGHDALRLCVLAGHRLAEADQCTMPDLRGEAWIVCPASTLGRLVLAMCVSPASSLTWRPRWTTSAPRSAWSGSAGGLPSPRSGPRPAPACR